MMLKALKPLLYGGKTHAEGDEFEAFSPLHARTLVATRKAVLVEEEVLKKSAKAKAAKNGEPDEDAPANAKGKRYQTRKLLAEND